MRINLAEVGGSNVLAQAISGRSVLRKLLVATDIEPDRPEPVFLDFEGVDVATSSFLRESVLSFRDTTRTRRSNLYPLVSNANATVKEELIDMLRLRGEAMLGCNLSDAGVVSDVELLGALDPKHRQTFDLVVQLGETDAGTLKRDYGEDEAVSRTAWNNRLATLAGLGLVIEVSQGRAKRYKPLLDEGVSVHGH
jgi:hypothetical protein